MGSSAWDIFHKTCSVAALVAVFILLIVTQVNIARREQSLRYCFVGPEFSGSIIFDTSVNSITWDYNINTTVTALEIYGPYESGNPNTAALATSLCGTSGTAASACDITTEPGRLKGSSTLVYINPPETIQSDVRVLINDIRDEPMYFTHTIRTTTGTYNYYFTSYCGYRL